MIYVVVAVAVVIVIVIGVILSKGGSRQEPGVVSFRRHIDALSPESRREVMDRVRPAPRNDDLDDDPDDKPKG